MRRLIGPIAAMGIAATVPADAADMVFKAPPKQPAFTWQGFYVGAHVGGGWGQKSFFDPVASVDNGSHHIRGLLGGWQLGINLQNGRWVWGLEAQLSAAGLTGSHVDPSNSAVTISTRVNWFGTAAARVGYAFDRTLLYVKGGAAFAHDKHVADGVGPGSIGFFNATRWTWKMAGAGVEHAFAPQWSAKIEYNYMDFGTERLMVNVIGVGLEPEDVRQTIHVVKVGVNYRFAAR